MAAASQCKHTVMGADGCNIEVRIYCCMGGGRRECMYVTVCVCARAHIQMELSEHM